MEREISPRQIEKTLKIISLAEMILGVGLALVPAIGVGGVVIAIAGATQYALIERQKNKKQQ